MNLFTIQKNKLSVNDNLLDIYASNDKLIPDWQPTKEIGSINDIKIWFFDIETTGIDPNLNQVKMIGNMLNNGKILIFNWLEFSEIEMLQTFFIMLEKVKPDVLTGHNIWKFDIPFIIRRCQILGIKHPFWGGKEKIFRTAQDFGKPTIFNQYWLKFNGHTINIIDTMLQTKSKDFVERKLISYSLKSIPIDWGLREKTDRLELDYTELLECYNSNNTQKITEYLIDDLKDTALIFDRIFPEIFYQTLFLDWKLQSIATSGNGSKWNTILKEFYPYEQIKPEDKLSFDGGYTWGKAGIFHNIEKLDVSSLYPSIMLRYGIHSKKDYKGYQLRILKYLTTERLRLKKLKDDKNAQDMSNALKIFINSSYGFLGVTGLEFNDMQAAALVTAYGRVIVKKMRDVITSAGSECVEIDTDGILYQLNKNNGEDIRKIVQDNLPSGIVIDREKFGKEYGAKLLFVPPQKNNDDDENNGLKKNYIIVSNDKTIAKGRYAKRNVCKLEREFQVKFLELYVNSKNDAIKYYKEIIRKIKEGRLEIEDIKIKRKAKSNEKKVYELGLVDSDGVCEYYMIPTLIVMTTKTKWDSIPGNRGHYCINFYVDLIEKQFNQMKLYL